MCICTYMYMYDTYMYIYTCMTLIRVHTIFIMHVLCLHNNFFRPTASQFPALRRQEHIQDVIESTSGPTSKWCKDIAKLLKCHLAQSFTDFHQKIEKQWGIHVQMVIYSFLAVSLKR